MQKYWLCVRDIILIKNPRVIKTIQTKNDGLSWKLKKFESLNKERNNQQLKKKLPRICGYIYSIRCSWSNQVEGTNQGVIISLRGTGIYRLRQSRFYYFRAPCYLRIKDGVHKSPCSWRV